MAGDWMKFELSTPDKPEIVYIAGLTSLDPDAVVGKLIRVWAWFDKHTTDGHALGVTYAFLDRITNCAGFAEAMAMAGWLKQSGSTLILPNFDRHNGKSAKKRAVTNSRQSRHRHAASNAVVTPKALPEKRREEVKDAAGAAGDDPKKKLFDAGVSLLTRFGSSEGSARSFLAKHCKNGGEPKLAELIGFLTTHPKVEPKSYIERAMRASGDGIGSYSAAELAQ